MLRLTTVCLAFVLLGAAAPIVAAATAGDSSESAVRDPDALARRQPDTVLRNTGNQAGSAIDEDESATEQAASEPNEREPANTEPAEIKPLIPIETKTSIRVNANVSLPQDI